MPDDSMASGLDASSDIASILAPSTSGSSDTTGASGGSTDGQPGSGETGKAASFQWGGKQYPTRQAAEEAHNKLYGKYSEQQGIFNQLKEAFKNPQLFAQFSKDPQFSQILAKLGIQQGEEDLRNQIAEDQNGQAMANLPPQLQQFARQMQVSVAKNELFYEKMDFEQRLGRKMSADENNAVMGIIAKADSLSIDEAWRIVNYEKALKEQAEKLASQRPANGNRPRPTPPGIPGMKLDTKKGITDMNAAEWRENFRNSPEFQNLMKP